MQLSLINENLSLLEMKECVETINNDLTYFRYNKQHIIPLEEVKLQSLEDEAQYKNGWLICTKGKSFAVYAATATEKQEWMAHIDKVFMIYSAVNLSVKVITFYLSI